MPAMISRIKSGGISLRWMNHHDKTGLTGNLTGKRSSYRTFSHGWAFRPLLEKPTTMRLLRSRVAHARAPQVGIFERSKIRPLRERRRVVSRRHDVVTDWCRHLNREMYI
jgi:hypothetical protein